MIGMEQAILSGSEDVRSMTPLSLMESFFRHDHEEMNGDGCSWIQIADQQWPSLNDKLHG